MNSVVYPIGSGFVGHNGTPVWLDENQGWDGDNEFVQAHPEMFAPRDPAGVPIPDDQTAVKAQTRKPKNG